MAAFRSVEGLGSEAFGYALEVDGQAVRALGLPPEGSRPSCEGAWLEQIRSPEREKHLVVALRPGAGATLRWRSVHPRGGDRAWFQGTRDPRHALLRDTIRPDPGHASPLGLVIRLPYGLPRAAGAPLSAFVRTLPGQPFCVEALAGADLRRVEVDPASGSFALPTGTERGRVVFAPAGESAPSGGPVVEVATPVSSKLCTGLRAGWEFTLGPHGALALSTEHALDARHGAAIEYALIAAGGGGWLNFSPTRFTLGAGAVLEYLPVLSPGLRARAGFGWGPLELGLRVDAAGPASAASPYVQLTL